MSLCLIGFFASKLIGMSIVFQYHRGVQSYLWLDDGSLHGAYLRLGVQGISRARIASARHTCVQSAFMALRPLDMMITQGGQPPNENHRLHQIGMDRTLPGLSRPKLGSGLGAPARQVWFIASKSVHARQGK